MEVAVQCLHGLDTLLLYIYIKSLSLRDSKDSEFVILFFDSVCFSRHQCVTFCSRLWWLALSDVDKGGWFGAENRVVTE